MSVHILPPSPRPDPDDSLGEDRGDLVPGAWPPGTGAPELVHAANACDAPLAPPATGAAAACGMLFGVLDQSSGDIGDGESMGVAPTEIESAEARRETNGEGGALRASVGGIFWTPTEAEGKKGVAVEALASRCSSLLVCSGALVYCASLERSQEGANAQASRKLRTSWTSRTSSEGSVWPGEK